MRPLTMQIYFGSALFERSMYHFAPDTLTAMLEKCGFAVSRVRQDPIAKDFAPSLGYRLGAPGSLDSARPNLLGLPFDGLAWALRRSGLMTAYARRNP